MTHRHKDAPLADLLMLPLAALLRLEEQRIVFAARALRLEAQARTLEAERDATPILDPLRIVKTTRVESYKRLLAIAQTKLRILDAEIGARA